MSEPHSPKSDLDHLAGNDATQKIPIVQGGYDVADYETRGARSATPTDYALLPTDAFAPKARPKNRHYALIATAGVGVLGVIIGGAFWIFAGDGDDTTAATGTSPAAPVPTPIDEVCPARSDGNVTTGRDAGGTDSSAGVIKAFNDAYYTQRDANAVSQFVLPAARPAVIPSLENLQKAIDALPANTTHCLTITDLGGGLNRVDLAQFDPAPGGDRATFHQLVQTTNDNGRWLIVSNTAVD